MLEGIAVTIIGGACLAVILAVARSTWKCWTSPVTVTSTDVLPTGVSSDAVIWRGLSDPRPRVLTGPLKRAEWHFRDGSTHMILVWAKQE
jgi:hypothetical protein